jgi:hypothetical protein
MFVLLYFVPPFLAYRMGARGGWLWANILLSWPAFAVWLMVRAPDKELLRRREDGELERTLMIVRAMNPALADEIAEKKAYERLAPLMATRPPKAAPRSGWAILAILAVLIAIGALAQQIAGTQPPAAQTADHSSVPATAPSGDRACSSSEQQRLAVQKMITWRDTTVMLPILSAPTCSARASPSAATAIVTVSRSKTTAAAGL